MYINRKIVTAFVVSYLVTSILYKLYISSTDTRYPLITTEISTLTKQSYLINTMKCQIPDYTKTIQFHETDHIGVTCGDRAVFVNKINEEEVVFKIDGTKAVFNKIENYHCCYQNVHRSNTKLYEDKSISYTNCEPFIDGTKAPLNNEIFKVTCTQLMNGSAVIYEDAYLILKKLRKSQGSKSVKDIRAKWNVLVIGIDSMSRGRIYNSMPKTAKYLKHNNWLDFRGYHKVDYNTFPNIMALLTGLSIRNVNKACANGMHACNHLMLWNKYKKLGYVTAYGEDYLMLPDTFERFNGFKTVPTDHYIKPFFLIGEHGVGNLMCLKHRTSPQHILDYAYDFADAYKNENFFGAFWLNSLGHNLMNLPTLHDDDLVQFLMRLHESGVTTNTFIVLVSDHGIRFGDARLKQIQFYYEERLPMLFVWTPLEFRKSQQEEYHNMLSNQRCLTTPYDLHLTLNSLIGFSKIIKDCPLCTSLVNPVPETRSCNDAGVHSKWCTCHFLATVNDNSEEVIKTAVEHVQKMLKSIQTTNCMQCSSLQLDRVHRIHAYRKRNNITNFVIAFEMSPGNRIFEANVLKTPKKYIVLESIHSISAYKGPNTKECVVNRYDAAYCICIPKANCKNSQ